MSRHGKKLQQRRSVARIESRPSGVGEARIVGDPITIGPDRSINVDMTKLSAPSNVYDADFAWIVHRPGSVSLFFAKRNLEEDTELRTRLELRYPPENLVHHFWKNSRDFHQRLRKFIEHWPKDEKRDQLDPSKWKAQKDHSEWVNFEAMAHAGTEAALDFYVLSPTGLARFSRGQGSSGLAVQPIVRVQMTIFELGRLLDSAAEVVTAIEAYLPKKAEIEALDRERTL